MRLPDWTNDSRMRDYERQMDEAEAWNDHVESEARIRGVDLMDEAAARALEQDLLDEWRSAQEDCGD